jgi:hypothetical protein
MAACDTGLSICNQFDTIRVSNNWVQLAPLIVKEAELGGQLLSAHNYLARNIHT